MVPKFNEWLKNEGETARMLATLLGGVGAGGLAGALAGPLAGMGAGGLTAALLSKYLPEKGVLNPVDTQEAKVRKLKMQRKMKQK